MDVAHRSNYCLPVRLCIIISHCLALLGVSTLTELLNSYYKKNSISVFPHLSESKNGQMSGTGGVAGRSLASAMMCSNVMSVCVQTSTTHTSCAESQFFCTTVALAGVRRRTWTTMGSRLMASTTDSSCSTLEKSRPFTLGEKKPRKGLMRQISL